MVASICLVLCIAGCRPTPAPRTMERRAADAMLAPDAAADPCRAITGAAITDASIATTSYPRDAFSFEGEIIEDCLVHPEGIID